MDVCPGISEIRQAQWLTGATFARACSLNEYYAYPCRSAFDGLPVAAGSMHVKAISHETLLQTFSMADF